MGNDGGTIPRRFEIVKQTAKATKLDEKTLRKALFAHCALSKRPLEAPLVACGLGNLYNKDAILEFLLQPTKYGEGPFICPHITSLKDVADLKGVTFNPHYRAHARTVTTSVTNTQHHDRAQPSPLLCPLTLKECNGSNRFEFNWGCGCLYAQKARLEMGQEAPGRCVVCGQPAPENDIVPVYPNRDDAEAEWNHLVNRTKERAVERLDAKKRARKAAKAKKEGRISPTSVMEVSADADAVVEATGNDNEKKRKFATAPVSESPQDSSSNQTTSSDTAESSDGKILSADKRDLSKTTTDSKSDHPKRAKLIDADQGLGSQKIAPARRPATHSSRGIATKAVY